MADTVKRVNYYDHQFLRAPDFTDEQNYHLTMRRLHNSALHTWGIVQGLQVTVASGGTGTAVTVSAGVAMDSTGREMVLPADTNMELGGEAAGTTLNITIAYGEQQSDPTTEAGGPGNTRISESPRLSFSATAPADKSMTLILAKVPRTSTGLGPVDGSDRKQAGVVLGTDLTINTLTLKKDGVAQPNWPVLSCSAANQAVLPNAGLSVGGSVGIGPAAPNRNLSVSGAGPAGTYANVKNANHEILIGVDVSTVLSAMTPSDLHIRTNNVTRMLVQANTGNIGIGTPTPISELHIRNDAPSKLGPNITLMNGGGGAGAAAAIDFDGYDTGANPPASRIQGIDDGAASAHLTFSSKQPGAAANPLVESMRLTSAGDLGIGLPNPDRDLTIFRTGIGTPAYANVKNSNHEILIGVDASAIVSAMTASDLQIRTNNATRMVVKANTGNVGIGVDPPGFKLDVSERMRVRQGGTPSAGIWMFQTTPNNDRAFIGMATDTSVGFFGNTGASWGLQMDTTTGNVGIGTAPTGLKLFVAGIIQCAQVIGAKIAYVADRFINQTGDTLEQGDVVVISGDQPFHYYGAQKDIPIPEVDTTDTAYDTRVCGIVVEVHAEVGAAEGDGEKVAPARTKSKKSSDAVPPEIRMFGAEETAKMDIAKVEHGQIGLMATLGTYANCKVDADIAPIKIGDLLTTSPTKGHAQKLLNPGQALGAVVGKALAPLKKGKGKIPVLVTLQ